MPLTNLEFESIIDEPSKRIEGNIDWTEDEDHSPCFEFRANIESSQGWPLFVRGSFNPLIPALTYALIHKGAGRIYALDLGKDHHNPQCNQVGEKHKHKWTEQFRDKEAYSPDDITAPASEPTEVWAQFCAEARIEHHGIMRPPPPPSMGLFE